MVVGMDVSTVGRRMCPQGAQIGSEVIWGKSTCTVHSSLDFALFDV